MTPTEIQELNEHLRSVAAILFRNTPEEKRQDFERIERTLREQILTQVTPAIGSFFLKQQPEPQPGELEK
jgi:hypothetical protein